MNDEKIGCSMENSFTEVSSGVVPMLEQKPHLSFIKLIKIKILYRLDKKIFPYLMPEKYWWNNLTTFLVIVLSLVIAE